MNILKFLEGFLYDEFFKALDEIILDTLITGKNDTIRHL